MTARFDGTETVVAAVLAPRLGDALAFLMGDRVPRDLDDFKSLDPLMVEAICDGDDPYRKHARKWVIV